MNQLAMLSSENDMIAYTPAIGAIGYLSLNYNDVKCLEMAIYFLTEQLYTQRPHPFFTDLRDYHIRYLTHLLSNRNLRNQLRFDGTNKVMWPITCSEDAEWLALALEVGIMEDTIIAMAADDANYERDMATMYAETDKDFRFAEESFNNHYRTFHQYYCQISHSKYELLTQLRQILNNQYS